MSVVVAKSSRMAEAAVVGSRTGLLTVEGIQLPEPERSVQPQAVVERMG